MLVILAIAALAILICVVLVSLGKGGELTEFPPDVPPLNLPEAGQLTAVDLMALELPVNVVGYHTQSVDESLRRAATAISARDTRIAVLEQRVSELLSRRLYARQEVYAAPGGGPRTDHEPEAPAAPRDLPEEGDSPTESGEHLPQAVDGNADHAPATWGEVDSPAASGDRLPRAVDGDTDHAPATWGEVDSPPESGDRLPQAVDGDPEQAPVRWGDRAPATEEAAADQDSDAKTAAQGAETTAQGAEMTAQGTETTAQGAETTAGTDAGRASEPEIEREGEPARVAHGKGSDERP
ncbi:hypothetical protein [Nonomuraea glycinis]|uniref:hypothetical protein n=1 Tax=Nonomuraea glycinis TaxID=2047744 RepID=UPI002E1073B1|nr:hypothetical protein OHA68_05440 [Nonomuraea glycinis]